MEQKANTFLFTANDIIKFRFEEHDPVNIVTHQEDLKDLFPDVDREVLDQTPSKHRGLE